MQVYLQLPRPTPRDYEILDGLNRITGDKNVTSVFLLGIVQMWLNEENDDTIMQRMKEDTKLKGLCKECTHRNSCEDAKRYLEITACSNYRKWKKKVVKE